MTESIGKVVLNYEYYSGEDLYSDGDDMENMILDIVKNQTGYEYVNDDYGNWAVMYHLSRQRENIIDPMEISPEDEVLEIGAGMGAVTGALARKAAKVDCIELSKRRSLVNAYRHKDMDNIEIMVGNFQDIKITKKYDVITLIGVLEYAYHYIDSRKPYEDFIETVAKCLKPGGRLYIAIENKLGMKYFAGYHEDHLGKPFVGIEGYHRSDKVKTFSKSQLEQLLLEHGFATTLFYYPFPDYKLPTVIYSEDVIDNIEIEFPEKSNYDLPVLQNFNMNKAFASLKGTSERKIFANSFLVEAVKR
ncbi:MAG: class I SAM-dependent methyltransferase [Lachnospiraceae bacterium]|nr:class I SAM-dependent methyltransferase [Lachnospiraceae bacterium]